jgi:hypothetical protein
MSLNRWQEAVLDLFTEVGRIEPLIRTRVNASRPAGLDENAFIILNQLRRVNTAGETRGALALILEGLEPDFDKELSTLIDAELVAIEHHDGGMRDRLRLTPLGQQTHEVAVKTLSPEFEQLMADLSIETIEGAMETLREIRRTLDNLPDR